MLTGSPLCQLTTRFHLIKEDPSPLKASELVSSSLEFQKATRTCLHSWRHSGGGEAVLPGSLFPLCSFTRLSPPSCWHLACPGWTRVLILLCRSHTSGPRQRTFVREEDVGAAPASGADVIGAHCWVCLTLAQGRVWRLEFA